MSGSTESGARAQPRDDRLTRLVRYFREHPRLRLATIAGPPYAILVLFFVLPLLVMVVASFRAGTIDGAFTLQNYVTFVTSGVYYTVFWRTLTISIEVTVIVGVIGYLLAYSMVRFTRWTTVVLLLVILPFWTSYIIRMYAWINILQSGGVLDSTLLIMNVIQEPLGILYSHDAVIIGFTYVWLPLAILPFYASLTNMDPDLIEAGKDLGAGPIKTFFTVTLPTTSNGVIAGLVLVFIPTFGSFITPRLLGGTTNIMIGMVIENQFKQAFNWPFGAAIGMVVSIIVVALLLLAVYYGGDVFERRGETP